MDVFISYCSKNSLVADKMESFLLQKNVQVHRDISYLSFNSDVKDFMKRIREADYALTIVSDEYLKSENCMYEVHELYKESDVEKKILPVVVEGAKIYDMLGRSTYLRHWHMICTELDLMLRDMPGDKGIPTRNELNIANSIYGHVDRFTTFISTRKHVQWDMANSSRNFQEISDYLKLSA